LAKQQLKYLVSTIYICKLGVKQQLKISSYSDIYLQAGGEAAAEICRRVAKQQVTPIYICRRVAKQQLTLFLLTDLLLVAKRKGEERFVVLDHCPRSVCMT
jgi:hypothetical protein